MEGRGGCMYDMVSFRVLDIQAAARVRHGGRGALTGIDIRFGGGGGEGMHDWGRLEAAVSSLAHSL